MSNLPLEVIHDILLFLPVKSVLRFKCVCKPVNAIFCSQSFTAEKSSKNRKLISLLSKSFKGRTSIALRFYDFNNNFKPEFVFEKLALSSNDYIVDYSNGLFALYLGSISNRVLVWNPTTRQYRTLPPCPFEATTLRRLTIGYDSTIDDYKIVALADMSLVWVFALKSSQWRRAKENFPGDISSPKSLGDGSGFADGALHFVHRNSMSSPMGYMFRTISYKIVACKGDILYCGSAS